MYSSLLGSAIKPVEYALPSGCTTSEYLDPALVSSENIPVSNGTNIFVGKGGCDTERGLPHTSKSKKPVCVPPSVGGYVYESVGEYVGIARDVGANVGNGFVGEKVGIALSVGEYVGISGTAGVVG